MLPLLERALATWLQRHQTLVPETIAPRAALAAAAALLLTLAAGPRAIRWLRARFREPIKSASADVERLHRSKAATPTMGGLLVVGVLCATVLAFCRLDNPYLPIVLGLTLGLCALGAADDLVKQTTSRQGLSARSKLAVQGALALCAAIAVYRVNALTPQGLELAVPVWGTLRIGWLLVPLAALAIVGSSNAVNLTDGLDGLAGGCLACAAAAVGVLCYAAGDAGWAGYLGVPYLPQAGEMAIVAAALVGGMLGFLWFNCHPASVFLGDAGSLPLGGLLGLLAVVARQELLLVAIGGVFVIETLSVIAQVGWFRCTRRRLLLCAPLHHHFQLLGWSEDKIVVRLWIASAVCAVVGLAAVKSQPTPALHGPPRSAQAVGPSLQEAAAAGELF
jgi:phospho-N-acetylmuramoyl-pentapeptide-transferase